MKTAISDEHCSTRWSIENGERVFPGRESIASPNFGDLLVDVVGDDLDMRDSTVCP